MPTTVVNSIPWQERPGVAGSLRAKEQDATREGAVAWGQFPVFLADMLGTASPNGSGGITRRLPEEHPVYPWLWCTDVELLNGEGRFDQDANSYIYFHDGAKPASDGNAHFTLKYEWLPYDLADDSVVETDPRGELSRYVEREFAAEVESLQMPGTSFKWVIPAGAADPAVYQIQEPLSRPLPTVNLKYTWHRVPSVSDNWYNFTGRVNEAAFDVGNPFKPSGFDVGTLLYLKPEIRRYNDITGIIAHDVIFHFAYRPTGWNQLYRRGADKTVNQCFREATVSGNSNYPTNAVPSPPDGDSIYNWFNHQLLWVLT